VAMGYEDASGQTSGDAGDDRIQVAELTARVFRLEQELAALQLQMNNRATFAQPAPAKPAARTLPIAPPPMPVAPPPGARQQAAQAWIRPSEPRPAISAAKSPESFEDRLGSQIFNRIAIVLLLIGTAYGLKLAVDRGLIGPTGRVLAGLVAGAGLVVWSERFRRKGFATFSYSLKAVGSGILYLSLWAAFQLFHLLSAPAALAMMVLVTTWNAYMAWAQDSELLAVYALAGGFATPMLVSTGGNHEIFLFTYLLAIDVATLVLVRLKQWPRLLLGSFPATVLFFLGWYLEFYSASALGLTSLFVVLFGAVFAIVSLGRSNVEPKQGRLASLQPVLIGILLPLANAAFVALAMYSMLDDANHHALLPWLMVALAAAYLGLMTAPQTRVASAIHLSLAVMFLTIAIPLKASGHWITVSWLVEGLALLWVAARVQSAHAEDEDSSLASSTLRWLGSASLMLGFCGVCFNVTDLMGTLGLPLMNKGTGTALTGIAVFAAAAWLALRAGDTDEKTHPDRTLGWSRITIASTLLVAMTAILLTARELLSSLSADAVHPPFQTADFFTAVIGLAVLAGVVAISLRVEKTHAGEDFWRTSAVLSTIAFNLIAVLTGVREVSVIWNGSAAPWSADAALRQALAISAFLMFYGAVLLAAGFWRRNSFLRWQALVLLVFTIFKTFLYDMRSLSQGYRVVSVLGLGVLLMAISFAYQKDWLNLREPAPTDDASADAGHEATE
jgi:uncharacterized membrane protein